jgi:hypothetical protein
MPFCGCKGASDPTTQPVLQSRSGYFKNGMSVNGEKWEGEYYILSAEAYEALMLN